MVLIQLGPALQPFTEKHTHKKTQYKQPTKIQPTKTQYTNAKHTFNIWITLAQVEAFPFFFPDSGLLIFGLGYNIFVRLFCFPVPHPETLGD